jgi:hypothetical protein
MATKKAFRIAQRKQNPQPSEARSTRLFRTIVPLPAHSFGFRQKPKHLQQLL